MMKTISVSDLSLHIDQTMVDCFVLDEEAMDAAREITKRHHALVLKCPNPIHCCAQSTTDLWKLSHDVFKSLDHMLSKNDYMTQRDINRFQYKTNTMISHEPDRRFIMLLWSKVLDRVYPHVWDELQQVYNVEFLKMQA